MKKPTKELEVSILDVDAPTIIEKITTMGAKKVQEVRLRVDWYRPRGLDIRDVEENKDPWCLRIRSYNNENHEVTWKAKTTILELGRTHKEINFLIPEPHKLADLFIELGLEHYAYQEKDRVTYRLNDISFDFDTYPGMPTLMEIEGPTQEALNKAITMLAVEGHRTWNQGEPKLVRQVYGLNWYDMRF